jgi:vitamin B12 transporter
MAQVDPVTQNTLDAVVVTADRTEETLRNVSQSMEIISGDDLRESGAYNISDYLKKYGLQTNPIGGLIAGDEGISMRGMSTGAFGMDLYSNILILIDGRRAGSDTLTYQNSAMIERIEIIKGPGAVQYGAAAMAGVINFITKKGTEKTTARVEAGVGSAELTKASASITGSKDRFKFAAGSTYSKQGKYTDGAGNLHQSSDYKLKNNNAANIGFDIDENNRLNFTASYSVIEDLGSGSNASYRSYYDRNLSSYDLRYEGGNSKKDMSWFLRYYLGNAGYKSKRDPSRAYPNPIRNPTYVASENENNFQGAQVHYRYDPGKFSLMFGVDWLLYKFDQIQRPTTMNPFLSQNSDINNYGLFFIGKAYLLSDRNLIITAGARYDTYDIGIDIIRNAFNFPMLGINIPAYKGSKSRDLDNFLPSFGIAYNPLDWLKVRANYGKAFKVPTPRELVGNFFMGPTLYYGNTNLEPESAETFDVGFDLAWESTLNVSASYYNTHYDNYIASRGVIAGQISPDGTPYPSSGNQYYNIRQAKISGIELSSRFNFGRYFNWDFDLTPYFNYNHLFNLKTNTGSYLPEISKTNIGAGLDFYSADWDLNFSIGVTYKGVVLIRTFAGQDNVARTGGVTIYDFSLTKGLINFSDGNSLKLKVAATNVTDKKYATFSDNYMPGRAFFAGLVYDLK